MSFFARTEGMPEVIGELDRLQHAADAEANVALGLGYLHRFLMGISADYPPAGRVGVLPVRSGRLKNSFFQTPPRRSQNAVTGLLATNVIYARPVEDRRGFLARTVREGGPEVQSIFLRSIRGQS